MTNRQLKRIGRSALPIETEEDVVQARQHAQVICALVDMGGQDEIRLATIVSELTRNMLKYAGRGRCEFEVLKLPPAARIRCICRDEGPGIRNLNSALKDGFSTAGSLGIGLPGVKRLADNFAIETCRTGTTVQVEVQARS